MQIKQEEALDPTYTSLYNLGVAVGMAIQVQVFGTGIHRKACSMMKQHMETQGTQPTQIGIQAMYLLRAVDLALHHLYPIHLMAMFQLTRM